MNISWRTDEDLFKKMQESYNTWPAEESLFFSHYDLARNFSSYTVAQWKEFILHPKVSEYITEELMLYQENQLRLIIKSATKHGNSVGTAQIINALGKQLQTNDTKIGNFFIYSHVPLNEQESQAEHTHIDPTVLFNFKE